MIALMMTLALTTTPLDANVDIDEHLGAQIPLALSFTDQDGHTAPLAEQFHDGKPVIVVLSYLRCEQLCDLVLRGLVDSISHSRLQPGVDFHAITVSIDPKDHPPQARLRRHALLQTLNRPDAPWTFLVGAEKSIAPLADRLGWRYVYDPRSDQYAHPASIFILTPDGHISRYLYGVNFRPLDLELALAEASRGKIGNIVGRVLLTCFRWDPAARKYGFVVSGILKGGSALVFLILALSIFYLVRLERRRAA